MGAAVTADRCAQCGQPFREPHRGYLREVCALALGLVLVLQHR